MYLTPQAELNWLVPSLLCQCETLRQLALQSALSEAAQKANHTAMLGQHAYLTHAHTKDASVLSFPDERCSSF